MPSFVIEPLLNHDKRNFCSAIDTLDIYLREQAAQDVRRRVATCFVAVDDENNRIAGYYTISASGVDLTEFPEEQAKRLPRYPLVPAARLGRLAVDQNYRGQKLGAALLCDAIERVRRSDLAAVVLIVDAKDDTARNFYLHHGFLPFKGRPLQLFYPLGKR
ncbi:MAG: GNAT family N-acetyltransferase [Chloroflexi bacterium]|nr:GNAT family N-acetyltransferase [Chloroflexota bacterium]